MLETNITNNISFFFKLSAGNGIPKERSPEVQERFNKILESYILSSRHPNIKDFGEDYQNLSDEEKEDMARQMSKIDKQVFESKYPEEDFSVNTYDILDSLDIESKPYGFYMHAKGDPNKICGYIYGSNAQNHISDYETEEFKDVLESLEVPYLEDIFSSLDAGKIFYVENLATTSECKSGLMPVGSILMIEMIKEVKIQGYKYIYAEFLRDSYELIKAAVSLNIFNKLGSEIIFDSQALGLDFGDSRSKVLIRLL